MSTVLWMLGCGSSTRLDPCGNSSLRLREFQSAEFCARYIDKNGFPIQAATIQCELVDGEANGANLDKFVQVTDERGEAHFNLETQFKTAFTIRCNANESGKTLHIGVTVARGNGGSLQVRITPAAAAAVTEAEVLLVEDFACIGLDSFQPPAPTSNASCGADGQQCIQRGVAVPATGATVSFGGLEPGRSYSVVTIGRLGDQVMAQGCTEEISISQQEIDQARTLITTVEMFDIDIPLSNNELVVTTAFDRSVGLQGLSALLQSLADGEHDPAYEIIVRAQNYSDGLLNTVLIAFADRIAQLATPNPDTSKRDRTKLLRVAQSLGDVNDMVLSTTLDFDDEADGSSGLFATHRVKFFEAQVGRVKQRYDFAAGTNAPTPARTKITTQNAGRIAFEKHALSVPIADLIIQRELFSEFGARDLTKIITGMIDCPNVAAAAEQALKESASDYATCDGGILSESCLIAFLRDAAIRTTMLQICQNVVMDLFTQINDQIAEDLRQSNHSDIIDFEGSADVILRPDGRTIERATGQWIGVGGFTARRF